MKIALMGDVMLGRIVNEMLRKERPEYPWGDVLSLVKGADLRVCNLECVLSDRGTPWSLTPKAFHFCSDEKNVESLKAAGIDLVSLANNHVLDYQEEALFRMLALLDREHIVHAGAGKTQKEAIRPALLNVRGAKVGFLAATDNEEEWEAGEQTPGIFYVPIEKGTRQSDLLFHEVRQMREKVELLIVSLHWGPNWGRIPPSEQTPFAHALIEEGVDIVFGHSGHVFRGIELYRGRPILYCAGDFIDDYRVDLVERNDESFLFMVEDMRRMVLYPTLIQQCQAIRAPQKRAKEILLKMQKACAAFQTDLEIQEDFGVIQFSSHKT